jgi:hypothetical protein
MTVTDPVGDCDHAAAEPRRRQHITMQERRIGRRILIRRKVDVAWDDGETAAWGRDIGIGGMYVESSGAPEPGANVRLTVRFRRAPAVSIPAQVCWKDENGFAVRFVSLGRHETETIRRVIEGG